MKVVPTATALHHPRFLHACMSRRRQQLCCGAGSLLRGSPARSPTNQQQHASATKGDVVGCLRKIISRRPRKTRARKNPTTPSSPRRAAAADDTTTMTTARERAESVAHAISYCKDTLQRVVTAASLLPRPSLDDWLHDNDRRQEEETIVASAAVAYCSIGTTTMQQHRVSGSPLTIVDDDVECRVLQLQPLPHRAMTQPATCSPSWENSWITANDVVPGKELLPHHGHHHTIDNSRFLKPLISRHYYLVSADGLSCMQYISSFNV